MVDFKRLHSKGITPIGITNFRNSYQIFGIKDNDRFGHIYVLGKTGVGKSTLLQSMALSDINRGHGITVIDPHGDVAEYLLGQLSNQRINDVIYMNPSDAKSIVFYNPIANVPAEFHHLVASGLISTFKRIWEDSWGPRLEYVLSMCIRTLLTCPDKSLLDIHALLTDPVYRTKALVYIEEPYILSFWKNEFEKYSPAFRAEVIAPILNKMGVFLSNDPLRRTLGSKSTGLDIQKVMDEGKILIVNLSKGKIGEQASSILGSILVNAIQLGALHRSHQPEADRRPFYLYVDEVHSFVSLSFADILAEARKYKLSIFMAHQFIEQLHEKIRAAIFGNVGTMIIFRVGAEDAKYLVQEFEPTFDETDLVNLPKFQMYLKLMIDGASSLPFSASTIPLKTLMIAED
jgi:energy-coupling factor transporter ATP-binding protein EcfA2